VVVTASNAGGHASAASNSDGPVLPPAAVNSIAPGISGTAQQGATLTASTGSWSNNPTYGYVWSDCTSSGGGCTAIGGATSSTYKLASTEVGKYVSVTVTASNPGGHGSVTSATVGPVLPPAPVSTTAPTVSGTPEQGDTISVASNGSWNNNPSAFTYAWEDCNSAGTTCSAIAGATSSSYTLSAADIGSTITGIVTAQGAGGNTSARSNTTGVVVAAPTPAASQPTTTALLVSPANLVTNQGVTLIATVTSRASSSTALWGAVTFEDAGATISGCANLPVKPSGQSATVACSTSFAASPAQLTAAFTPTYGSVLQGSVSPTNNVTIMPDSTSTSLDASSSVDVGASTTYTASVAPPAARRGPIEPTGSVEFLDRGQPIGSCASQAMNGGVATCTVTYTATGGHEIAARYVGDANFSASSSPTERVRAVLDPPALMDRIASTMQWGFYYTPSYTQIRSLVVNGVSAGTTVRVNCHGLGCPFMQRAALLTNRVRCGKKLGMCFTGGSFLITPGFGSRRLKAGTRITVEIVRPNWVGRYYRFTVRPRRAPRIQISCLAPGGSVPGQGC